MAEFVPFRAGNVPDPEVVQIREREEEQQRVSALFHSRISDNIHGKTKINKTNKLT